MTATCTVGGCSAPVLARGYCKRHYDRWRRHGDPTTCLKEMVARGLPMEWLREHAAHDGQECLTWPFARFPDGRAHMRAGKPARIMCELAHGPAPSRKHEAAHSCGRGHEACVNPKHLRWATPAENAADKIIHGTHIAGERHYGAKLSAEQVIEIRSLKGVMFQRDIAKKFGMGVASINKILKGTAWKDVRS